MKFESHVFKDDIDFLLFLFEMSDNELAAPTFGVRKRELIDMKEIMMKLLISWLGGKVSQCALLANLKDVHVVVPAAEMYLQNKDPITEVGVYMSSNGTRAMLSNRCTSMTKELPRKICVAEFESAADKDFTRIPWMVTCVCSLPYQQAFASCGSKYE